MERITLWEVRDGRGAEAGSYWSPNFISYNKTEEYARKTGFSFVVKQVFLGDEYSEPLETIYKLKGVRKRKLPATLFPSLECLTKNQFVSAHTHCFLCGEKKDDFKDSVAAHDWQFMHEVQHQQRCVEAWETEEGKRTKIPLRMWVREGRVLSHVLIEPPDPEMFSVKADDDGEMDE